MNRSVTALLICGLLGTLNIARSDSNSSIPLNEEYKGKTRAPDKVPNGPRKFTLDTVEIDLKSGQKVEFEVKAAGNRSVAVILHNADGDCVGASWPTPSFATFGLNKVPLDWKLGNLATGGQYAVVLNPKTARYMLSEAPATGTYKLTVIADIAGDYTLLASDKGKKRDAAAVRKEIESLKRQLAALEDELKAMEAKK